MTRGWDPKSLCCDLSFEEQYRLHGETLGEGAFGSVHDASCRRTGKTVAVKIWDKLAMNAQALRGVQSELTHLSALSHPGVLKLENWFEDERYVYAVVERLSGGDLLDKLEFEDEGIPEHEVAEVAWQVLQALEALHNQNIIHRDIKLENAMFEKPGSNTVKLVDMGFSTQIEEGQKLRERCGSLQYVAPEVLSGKGYDKRCDVYSLGAVLYAMLTTEFLFDGENDEEVQRKNSCGEVDWSSRFRELSEEAQDFVGWLLNADPECRPTVAEAKEHAWLLRRTSLQSSTDEDEEDFGASMVQGFVRQISTESYNICQQIVRQISEVAELATGAHIDPDMLWPPPPAEAKARLLPPPPADVEASSRSSSKEKREAPWWSIAFCSRTS